MKKIAIVLVSAVLAAGILYTSQTFAAEIETQPHTAGSISYLPSVGNNLSVSTSTVAVAPNATMYAVTDSTQLNTCYVVITKNTLWGVESSISCIANHATH